MGNPSDRWRRVEAVCQAALERDVNERTAFIATECGGDSGLRHEVEALLAKESAAAGFLSRPLAAVAADAIFGSSGSSLVGQTLGRYAIVGAIGAGGMGEVYRARDTELDRDVAIKVLPRAFVADRDRLARFEREARVLASLNHPNVAAIYGIERVDDVHALVLELVEGETLAERFGARASGLAIRDSLAIARQIAEALEAAHEKGIVHRDLKPANIKVTPAGTVKVLDFGLAKSGAGSAPDLSHSPMITINGTRDGVLLGTAAYMSPEQARGQAVDKRTDIWAYGCVLFEMLTGRIAFPGATVSDHIAAILERDPEWTALSPSTPSAIDRLVRRCLEKDPKRRLHDIADARIEIDEALTAPTMVAGTSPRQSRWSNWAAWSSAAVVFAMLAGWAAWKLADSRRRPVERTVTRFVLQSSAAAPIVGGFGISADGRQLVYVGGESPRRLFIRRLDQFDATPVAGTEGAAQPFFSVDGEWIGFFVGDKLQKVNARVAAAPVTLYAGIETGGNNAGLWLPDDTIVFTSRDHGLQRVSAEGGEPRDATTLGQKPREVDHHTPDMLPGGRELLFAIHQEEDRFSIAVQSLLSGERKVLIESGFAPQYSFSGHIVFARGDAILAAPFDVNRLEVIGSPVTLVEHVATSPRDGIGSFRLSTNGVLVYRPERSRAGRLLTWVDRKGIETPLPIPPRAFSAAQVSPDGKTVAFAAADGDRVDIWTYTIAADTLTRVTSEGENDAPLWTPDGRWLTYASNRGGTHHLIRQPVDGSGAAESLLTSRNILVPGAWTADNRTLLYVDWPPTDKFQMLALHLDRERHSESLGPRAYPNVSPDGRWLAFMSRFENGRNEVYVEPLLTSGRRHQVTVDGGAEPLWSRDGRELFYRWRGGVFRVAVDTSRGFAAGKPARLFDNNYVPYLGHDYDSVPGGRLLMIKLGGDERAPQALNVVVNWVDELTRRVASRK